MSYYHPHNRSNQALSGFTLVELLVVIAIIGILVSLLLPAITSVQERARRQKCAASLREMALAVQLYQQETNRVPAFAGRKFWAEIVASKLTGLSPKNLICPSGSRNGTEDNDEGNAFVPDYKKESTKGTSTKDEPGGPPFWVSYAGRRKGTLLFPSSASDPASTPISADRTKEFHRQGYNVLFLDCHVEFITDPDDNMFDDNNSGKIGMEVLTDAWSQ